MEAAAAGARQAGHEITNHHKLHGMDTNCAVILLSAPSSKLHCQVAPSPCFSQSNAMGRALLLSPVLLCAQVGDWKMVGFEE